MSMYWGPISPSRKSKRTPQFSFLGNTADLIECGLEHDSHQVWGFVIFRCTYSNDAAWVQRLAALRERARCTLEYYNGADIFARMEMTVVEDREALEGASIAVVKARFDEWVKGGAVERDQGTPDAGWSPRYRFCIRIRDVGDTARVDRQGHEEDDNNGDKDEDIEVEDIEVEDMDMEDKDEEGADEEDEYEEDEEPSVDLIWKDWEPSVPHPLEPDLPPVEGSTLPDGSTRPDVGWMRVADCYAMVEIFEGLYDPNVWYIDYLRVT